VMASKYSSKSRGHGWLWALLLLLVGALVYFWRSMKKPDDGAAAA
jgi:hypothetical protein